MVTTHQYSTKGIRGLEGKLNIAQREATSFLAKGQATFTATWSDQRYVGIKFGRQLTGTNLPGSLGFFRIPILRHPETRRRGTAGTSLTANACLRLSAVSP